MTDFQAISYAIRALGKHDEAHPKAFYGAGAPEAVARRLELVAAVVYAQAAVSGESVRGAELLGAEARWLREGTSRALSAGV